MLMQPAPLAALLVVSSRLPLAPGPTSTPPLPPALRAEASATPLLPPPLPPAAAPLEIVTLPPSLPSAVLPPGSRESEPLLLLPLPHATAMPPPATSA